MAEIVTFSPSPSIFGFGALEKLPEAMESRGYKRVLVFTDSQIVRIGILQRVLDMLKGVVECEVFDEVPAEPKNTDMEKTRDRFGKNVDALLGLGGGSSMDFAKALSIIMTHGGSLGDYLGEGSVPGPVIPIICAPTTSGTGSQSTQTAVFTIDGVKRGVSSEHIRPAFSIVDPDLTMNLPPEVTRNSGYDALMHACESYVARPHGSVSERPILYQGSNPFSRGLALEAFGAISRSYRIAVSEGSDRQAREDMSIGSHLAGLAFSHSGLGLVHALASSLGGMVDAPHGECLAACTEIGLRYNFEACKEDFETLADRMSDTNDEEPSEASGNPLLACFRKWIQELGLPSRPSELGIKKDDAETMLNNTLVQVRRIVTNPRPLDDTLLDYIKGGI